MPAHEHYRLAALKVTSETGTVPHARVVMTVGDAEVVAEVGGDGPVDAVFKAIERMAGSHASLLLYSVNAITGGTDAQGEVTVRLEQAAGSSTDSAPTPTSSSHRRRRTSTRSIACTMACGD